MPSQTGREHEARRTRQAPPCRLTGRVNPRFFGWIAFGWLAVALASAPAIYLSSGSASKPWVSGAMATLFSICTYLPWAIATPLLFWLCERVPVGERSVVRSLLVLTAVGIPITILLAASGTALGRIVLWSLGAAPSGHPFDDMGRAIVISSLFALPTYVAVIGVGQTLGWASRDRAREQRLIEAREQAMRAHLQPHFLFNALNAVAELGHADAQQADDALVHLSGILRTTLEAPTWHTLDQELAIAADLAALHQILLGERLAWTINVAQGVGDWPVPALILQPLVENALKFASNSVGSGHVHLTAITDRHDLQIHIENSCGDTCPSGTGRGLGMVQDRLAAIYGADAALRTHIIGSQFHVDLAVPRR